LIRPFVIGNELSVILRSFFALNLAQNHHKNKYLIQF
jgi:hypothetical protein